MIKIERKTLIWGGVGLVAVIVVVISAFFAWSAYTKQEVSTEEPVEIVRGFYQPWLEAVHSTTTDPFAEGLAESPLLSRELRASLKKAHRTPSGVDPVLCQSVMPDRVASRVIFSTEEKTEVVVTARDSDSTEQAIVTLLARDGGWYIDAIRCSPGEFGPEREFSFDREGYLLKNVPEPLNPQYWYLVFEENGQLGHYAPLFFSAESECVALDGSTAVCDPNTFIETAKAYVQGQMTETGVQVRRVQLKK